MLFRSLARVALGGSDGDGTRTPSDDALGHSDVLGEALADVEALEDGDAEELGAGDAEPETLPLPLADDSRVLAAEKPDVRDLRGVGDGDADRTPDRTVCVTVADDALVTLGDSDGDGTRTPSDDALRHDVALGEALADADAEVLDEAEELSAGDKEPDTLTSLLTDGSCVPTVE